MAHRHKAHHKAHGGAAHKETRVEHDTEEEHEAGLKRGGKAKHHGHKAHGHKGHHRMDKRARGGGVGADKSPFSSAHIKPTQPGGNPHPHKG